MLLAECCCPCVENWYCPCLGILSVVLISAAVSAVVSHIVCCCHHPHPRHDNDE